MKKKKKEVSNCRKALTCTLPMKYKTSSKPKIKIKMEKKFSQILLLVSRFEPRELHNWRSILMYEIIITELINNNLIFITKNV
jgi:hypothetical protein